ncbi:MAG: aminoacyl-tRNA hydrolase [Patescibacteria group bacterium]
MKVIVGLGNPGKEYDGTRHNVGREFAAAIAKKYGFESFEENAKYAGLVAKGEIEGEKTIIVLPNTFMNKSGKALTEAGVKPKDLIVIHDDTDIVLGSVKVSFGKRSAGHRGVDSVMRAVKSRDFWRIRVGVQKKKRVDAMQLVLKKWASAEKLILKKVEKRVVELAATDLQITTISVLI